MIAIPPGDCAPVPDLTLLAVSLVDQIPNIRNWLKRCQFSGYVIERAIDRVTDYAMPYLRGDKNHAQIEDWNKWLFGNAFQAAKQEATRQLKCQFVAPADLVDPAILHARTLNEPDEELQQQIGDALSKLTDKQRRAVELCIMQEKSPTEASREMDCNRSTVEHHLDRGLHLLRGILSNGTLVHSAKKSCYRHRDLPPSL
jgi:DNA-directed RNA polymerase specialized sigma24 family protein